MDTLTPNGRRARLGDRAGLDDLDRSLQLAPDDADAWRRRALVRRDAGDVPGAASDIRRSLELDPRNPEAQRLARELPGG